jgi:hypothetical protein
MPVPSFLSLCRRFPSAFALLAIVACGGHASGVTGSGSSSGTSSGVSAGTVSGESSGSPDATLTDGGGAPNEGGDSTTGVGGDATTGVGNDAAPSDDGGTAICSAYCTSIMAVCTGEASQYKDQADCTEYCSLMPAGTGMPGDTSDSIGCRSSHLPAAGTTANYLSCLLSGPDTFGACEDEYTSFCNVAFSYCTAANGYTGPALYTDVATCVNTTSLLPNNTPNSPNMYAPGNYSANFTPAMIGMDNSIDCRFYQLVDLAMDGADVATRMMNAAKYCPSVGNVSPNCGPGVTIHDQ